jgi:MATE family multidrug resistance protein
VLGLLLKNVRSVIPFSLGLATTIRVGHLVGEQNLLELKKAISTAVVLAVGMSLFTVVFTLLFRHYVAALYSPDPAVIALASSLLILATIYQFSDAVQVVAACALRGMKITKPVFFITLVSYWPIGFGLGAVLGLTNWLVEPMGAHGFWTGIIIGLTCAAILLSIVLRKHINRMEHAFTSGTAT